MSEPSTIGRGRVSKRSRTIQLAAENAVGAKIFEAIKAADAKEAATHSSRGHRSRRTATAE
jgi:hypothetical protein